MSKVYWSKKLDPESFNLDECGCSMRLFIVPNQWWSIRAWTLAASITPLIFKMIERGKVKQEENA